MVFAEVSHSANSTAIQFAIILQLYCTPLYSKCQTKKWGKEHSFQNIAAVFRDPVPSRKAQDDNCFCGQPTQPPRLSSEWHIAALIRCILYVNFIFLPEIHDFSHYQQSFFMVSIPNHLAVLGRNEQRISTGCFRPNLCLTFGVLRSRIKLLYCNKLDRCAVRRVRYSANTTAIQALQNVYFRR